MPRSKEASHVRVLDAAREEFLEYGFENASMRRIGARCGMTAAGLYRHCRDKADLFDLLVAPAAEDLLQWVRRHIARSETALAGHEEWLWEETEVDMLRELVYPRMDEYRLLLTKAQGTKYESYLHELVRERQVRMLELLDVLRAQGRSVRPVTPEELHLLLSAYTAALFEPVVHGYSLAEAERCLATVEAFFMPGWKALLGFA